MGTFDDDFDDDEGFDEPGDELEADVWHLFVMINPGDEDAAMQQFAAYRDAVAGEDPDAIDVADAVTRVGDWRSAFRVAEDDFPALIEALNELAARWNVTIDWGGDADDEDFLGSVEASELLHAAHDSLAPHGYVLWVCDTDDDVCSGWMTLRRDIEAMREMATDLGMHVRLGSEAG